MDVKDFIKSTISQIAEAIEELNNENVDGNDRRIRVNVCTEMNQSYSAGHYYVTDFDFKLALTVNDQSGTHASVGILTGIFGMGAKGDTSLLNSAVSTVSFKIPSILFQG